MLVADILSRSYLKNKLHEDDPHNMTQLVHCAYNTTQMSAAKKDKFQKAVAEDKIRLL